MTENARSAPTICRVRYWQDAKGSIPADKPGDPVALIEFLHSFKPAPGQEFTVDVCLSPTKKGAA